MNAARPHALFSFGTLLDDRVQKTLFGQRVPRTAAALAGHSTRSLTITDPAVIATSGLDVHLTLERRIGAEVEGAVLHLTEAELAAADAYEVDDYTRRRVRLSSGASAWAYLDTRPLRPAARVVIVGDSIAYGRCDPRGGWAARLAEQHIARDESDHRVFNCAVPGATLAEIAEQTPALLPARLPDTLVVAAGINDVAAGTAPGHLEAGLDALAATALAHGARLVVIGPTWLDEDRAPRYEGLSFTHERALALRETLRSWCTAHHIDHVDPWEALRDRSDLLADGLHPTPEGHEVLHHLMTTALA
ncbi:GDSL-type esterase/lipase family protein [Streptomyces sp. NBC_00083]|uniref:GDSL-type esterase/lipase family protein n=1 Tax=Streptomyces sp. NBC_00083 TaxID=2975647 RepID=UPI00225280B1|nr:GDSL-type esterase/lipase family protein [Streptomyces sp. NBC_00083]MCX5383026.1 GDSL-type esterase/lipase family protein [Streptomyces sp. NBC_00083]